MTGARSTGHIECPGRAQNELWDGPRRFQVSSQLTCGQRTGGILVQLKGEHARRLLDSSSCGGRVIAGTLTTTVLVAVDVSTSSKHPSGLVGSVTLPTGLRRQRQRGLHPRNGQPERGNIAGDILDREIGAVQTLNGTSASSPAALSSRWRASAPRPTRLRSAPASATPLTVAPATRDAGDRNVLNQAAGLLHHVTVTGRSFDAALTRSLDTVNGAPAGPKWIIVLFDGRGDVAQGTLHALQASGVRLRRFSPGSSGPCAPSLQQLAPATGQDCVAADPAVLAAALDTIQPDAVTAVRDPDHRGRSGWRTPAPLGAALPKMVSVDADTVTWSRRDMVQRLRVVLLRHSRHGHVSVSSSGKLSSYVLVVDASGSRRLDLGRVKRSSLAGRGTLSRLEVK